MSGTRSRLSRRNFLLALGAGGAAAGAGLVAQKDNDARSGKEEASSDARGYRLTEHIRKYYQTAKV